MCHGTNARHVVADKSAGGRDEEVSLVAYIDRRRRGQRRQHGPISFPDQIMITLSVLTRCLAVQLAKFMLETVSDIYSTASAASRCSLLTG